MHGAANSANMRRLYNDSIIDNGEVAIAFTPALRSCIERIDINFAQMPAEQVHTSFHVNFCRRFVAAKVDSPLIGFPVIIIGIYYPAESDAIRCKFADYVSFAYAKIAELELPVAAFMDANIAPSRIDRSPMRSIADARSESAHYGEVVLAPAAALGLVELVSHIRATDNDAFPSTFSFQHTKNNVTHRSRIDLALLSSPFLSAFRTATHQPISSPFDHSFLHFTFSFAHQRPPPNKSRLFPIHPSVAAHTTFTSYIERYCLSYRHHHAVNLGWHAALSSLISAFRQADRHTRRDIIDSTNCRRHLATTQLARLQRELARDPSNAALSSELKAAEDRLREANAKPLQSFEQYRMEQLTQDKERPTRAFFRYAAARSKSTSIVELLSSKGDSLTQPEAILNRIAEHYESVFKLTETDSPSQQSLLSFCKASLTEAQRSALLQPVTADEINGILRKKKNASSPGPNGITWEVLKANREAISPIYADAFTAFLLEQAPLPDHFKEAVAVLIPKHGSDSRDITKGWRPISLLNVDSKLFTAVLSTRLRRFMNCIISPTQAGIVPGRRIQDNILQPLIKQNLVSLGHGPPTTMVFSDLRAAFDTIDHQWLWMVLHHLGCPPKFVAAFSRLYTGASVVFITSHGSTRSISIGRGVRQGDCASPDLFVCGIDPLLRFIEDRLSGVPYAAPCTELLKCQAYLDDIHYFIKCLADLQAILSGQKLFGDASGVVPNQSKMAYMKLAPPNHRDTSSQPLPMPPQWKHISSGESTRLLGVPFGPTGLDTATIESDTLTKASAVSARHITRAISQYGRQRIVNTLIISLLPYRSVVVKWSKQFLSALRSIINSFLWRGSKWIRLPFNIISLPKERGGLGVINPEAHTLAIAAGPLAAMLTVDSNHPWVPAARLLFDLTLRKVDRTFSDIAIGRPIPANKQRLITGLPALWIQAWSKLGSCEPISPGWSIADIASYPFTDGQRIGQRLRYKEGSEVPFIEYPVWPAQVNPWQPDKRPGRRSRNPPKWYDTECDKIDDLNRLIARAPDSRSHGTRSIPILFAPFSKLRIADLKPEHYQPRAGRHFQLPPPNPTYESRILNDRYHSHSLWPGAGMPLPFTFQQLNTVRGIPVRHICFAWQVIHGIVATASKLHIVTGGLVSETCPICNRTSETWLHYLYYCPRVIKFWHLLIQSFAGTEAKRLPFYSILNGFKDDSWPKFPQPRKPTTTIVIALSVIFHAHTEAVYDKHPVTVSAEAMLARFKEKIVRYKVWGSRESEVPHPP